MKSGRIAGPFRLEEPVEQFPGLRPRNASELGHPPTACELEPGCRSPDLEHDATKTILLVRKDRVNKGTHPGSQHGNPSKN